MSVTVQSSAVQTMNTDYVEDDAEYVRKPVKDLKKQFSKQPGQTRKGRRRVAAPKEAYSDDEQDKWMIRESNASIITSPCDNSILALLVSEMWTNFEFHLRPPGFTRTKQNKLGL